MTDIEDAVTGGWSHLRQRAGTRAIPRLRGQAAAALLACVLLALVASSARSAPPALAAASDLASDGALAKERRVPVLLFFNRVGCPYCERALREFLKPMERDPANADRVLFRQVEIDKPTKLVDFKGEATTHRKFAQRYKIDLTPTIWFVDGEGRTLADPIVGLPTIDFYGAYLDQRIDDSLARLRAVQ